MDIRIGTDIVAVKRMAGLDVRARRKLFHPSETGSPERLAGILAAKECCKKALGARLGWLDIEVTRRQGKPGLRFSSRVPLKRLASSDLSISHDGGYAIAVAVFAFT